MKARSSASVPWTRSLGGDRLFSDLYGDHLVPCQHFSHSSALIDIVFELEIGKQFHGLSRTDEPGIFQQGVYLCAEIEIMQKSIFFIPYIHKSGIKTGHDLFNFSEINISYGKIITPFLMVKFDQLLILQQCERYLGRSRVDNKFFIQY
jgi:hypothetical protein